ncbi:MAG: class I SAM-dependent methyltransferase [Parvibaculaceae bacterium]
MLRTDTAHHAWDKRGQSPEGRQDWLAPEADVADCARAAHARGGRLALDLGCGVGRHALLLAEQGWETQALDGSASGIAHLKREAEARRLSIAAETGLMTDLPFEAAAFDYVLAFNVIYHGDHGIVERTVSEVRRVLKPHGIFQCTLLSKRNQNYGKGREVAPDSFVIDDVDDKDHPHFYCDAAGALGLLQGFEIMELADRLHRKPGSWHWHVVAERLS